VICGSKDCIYSSHWQRLQKYLAVARLSNGQRFKTKPYRKSRRSLQVITQIALLKVPDFNKVFDTHTDVSDDQLGSVISQGGHPTAYYSRKRTETQRNNMIGEREMLSVVETLNEFRTMILGYCKMIYMDHENSTRLTTVS
jgi:RNase H-like domain found in reverse transcriptase